MIYETPVDTPTILGLKEARQKKARYVFRLDEDQVGSAGQAQLPDSALLALAAITAASYGDRVGTWITLSQRTLDAYGKTYRWWYRATKFLEDAGFIECRRHSGRLPRYLLGASNLGKSKLGDGQSIANSVGDALWSN